MLRYTCACHCLPICAFMLHRFVAWAQWEIPYNAEEVDYNSLLYVSMLWGARTPVNPPYSVFLGASYCHKAMVYCLIQVNILTLGFLIIIKKENILFF